MLQLFITLLACSPWLAVGRGLHAAAPTAAPTAKPAAADVVKAAINASAKVSGAQTDSLYKTTPPSGNSVIPGPRTCFWARGPYSGDPYINVAYPDSNTFYWAGTFTVPEGAQLTFEGEFPYSRYFSFISYDEKGRPVESVADYLIKPSTPGVVNPFLPGADRNVKSRGYTLKVIDGKPDPRSKTGQSLINQTRLQIAAPKYGRAPGQQEILYRIYARNKGTDESGDVGLPRAVLTLKNGTKLTGEAACEALNSKQLLQVDATAQSIPMDQYQELLNAAANISATHPATTPPTWYLQLDREALYDIYRGKPLNPNAPRSEGGFYPNLDNQYIRTILNRKLGKVLVIRAKAPTTPKTVNGDGKMGSGELRYWSFCSNQGFANTRVNKCVFDEELPVDKNGYFTLVISRPEDRPRNAVEQCGVAWLPMAEDGDGSGDPDVTVLQLRNMLGTGNFSHSIQAIPKPGDEAKVMGEYFPKAVYMTTSTFESVKPCLSQ